jgi:hypothetical protein
MVMFEGVERSYEHIFCIPVIEKCNLDEVVCVVLSSRMALRTHNLPSGHLKKRFWRSR